jgi:hypothetical protein
VNKQVRRKINKASQDFLEGRGEATRNGDVLEDLTAQKWRDLHTEWVAQAW